MKLIPWAIVLRELGLSNTIGALVLIHTVQGVSFTTAVLPQLLHRHPAGPDEGRPGRRRGLTFEPSGASCCRSRRRS
jgi:hypothetical protein